MKWVKNLEEAQECLNEHIDLLKKKADGVIQKQKPLLKYTRHSDVNKYLVMTKGYRLGLDCVASTYLEKTFPSSPITEEGLSSVLSRYKATAYAWLEDNKVTHDENKKIIEFNKHQIEKLEIVLSSFGINPEYYEMRKPPRKRKEVSVKVPSHYNQDIKRVAIISDSVYDNVAKLLEIKYKQIETLGNKMLQEQRNKEAEKAKIKREQEFVHLLASLRVKYDLEYTDDKDTILATILIQNPYLYLAHYLLLNREDWNDGYDYAETGLSFFEANTEPKTDEDRAIVDELDDLCENWDNDGRVFRDCTYNYTYLFNKVPRDLLKDYNMLQGGL